MKGNWIEPVPDDTEGQAGRWGLEPIASDDVEGQGGRWGFLVPDETDPASQTWRLEEDDTEGQGIRHAF